MGSSRRTFLRRSSVMAAGFFALRGALDSPTWAASLENDAEGAGPYGRLVKDPAGLLDLPRGFRYDVVSRDGDPMTDGLLTPALPDGMAAFPGPDGLTILVRNHEVLPYQEPGAYGASDELAAKIDRSKLYDLGAGRIHRGGTTTVVYDTKTQKVVRHFLSLGGTCRNCAGGPTPWNSWVTCEEVVVPVGETVDANGSKYQCEKEHGYLFEVPATAEIELHKAVPLKAMGRCNHEAIAVDPRSGIVYLTEDRPDGIFYRFIPNAPGKLVAGGKLQALMVRDLKIADTRRWPGDPLSFNHTKHFPIGGKVAVGWIDMDDVESPNDDMRYRGFGQGAARFARAEGIWASGGDVFFACTNGGLKEKGQIWRYTPCAQEGQSGERNNPGMLELFLEPNNSWLLENCDNMTGAPWGDLVVCEDRQGPRVRLIGVTPQGQCYTLANHHQKCEFAGCTFSPDGSTLFVNIQQYGATLAITGPWQAKA